jgi:hypothetical protein
MTFTEEDVTDAVVWLLETNIPSFSPETSKMLLGMSQDIQTKLKSATVSDGAREFLSSFADWLYSVSVIGHLHQGAVIAKLAAYIAKGGSE